MHRGPCSSERQDGARMVAARGGFHYGEVGLLVPRQQRPAAAPARQHECMLDVSCRVCMPLGAARHAQHGRPDIRGCTRYILDHLWAVRHVAELARLVCLERCCSGWAAAHSVRYGSAGVAMFGLTPSLPAWRAAGSVAWVHLAVYVVVCLAVETAGQG